MAYSSSSYFTTLFYPYHPNTTTVTPSFPCFPLECLSYYSPNSPFATPSQNFSYNHGYTPYQQPPFTFTYLYHPIVTHITPLPPNHMHLILTQMFMVTKTTTSNTNTNLIQILKDHLNFKKIFKNVFKNYPRQKKSTLIIGELLMFKLNSHFLLLNKYLNNYPIL